MNAIFSLLFYKYFVVKGVDEKVEHPECRRRSRTSTRRAAAAAAGAPPIDDGDGARCVRFSKLVCSVSPQ